MAELLLIEKQRMRARGYELTVRDFEAAWSLCWAQMVHERAWPHATVHRRSWRQVQTETKAEFCAAFIDAPTAFELAAGRLAELAGGCGVDLDPVKLGKALLAAISLADIPEYDVESLDAAALAAREFVGLTDRSEIAA